MAVSAATFENVIPSSTPTGVTGPVYTIWIFMSLCWENGVKQVDLRESSRVGIENLFQRLLALTQSWKYYSVPSKWQQVATEDDQVRLVILRSLMVKVLQLYILLWSGWWIWMSRARGSGGMWINIGLCKGYMPLWPSLLYDHRSLRSPILISHESTT